MNATCVYITAARIVMQTDPADTFSSTINNAASKKYNNKNKDQVQRKLIYLHQSLPQLRQLLSCVVCCRLLNDPYSPRNAQCQHFVCRLCIRGKKSLQKTCDECSDCTDYNAYDEHKQMQCLLFCYKGLCAYVLSSPLYQQLQTQKLDIQHMFSQINSSGIPLPNMSAEDLVLEGANYDDASQLTLATTTKSVAKNAILLKGGKTNSNRNYMTTNKWVASHSSFCKVSPSMTNSTPPTIKEENKSALCELLKSEPLELFPERDSPMSEQSIVDETTTTTTPTADIVSEEKISNNKLFEVAANTTLSNIPTPLTIASAQLVSLKRQALKGDNIVSVKDNGKPVSYKLALTPSDIVNLSPKSQANLQPAIKALSNGSAMYSVLYTGIGNKITIKRKPTNEDVVDNMPMKMTNNVINAEVSRQSVSEERKRITAELADSTFDAGNSSKRRGCRCGNATPTPGKLTCCGQRCPCYVEAKSCTNCKCRGCRNPHRPGGGKIRPIIPKLSCYEIQINNGNGNEKMTTPVVPVTTFANTNRNQIYNYNSAIPIEYYEYNCIPVESKPLATTTAPLPIYTTQTHTFQQDETTLDFNRQLQNRVTQTVINKDGFISNMIAQNPQQQNECQKQLMPVHTTSSQKLSLYLQQLNKQNIIMHPKSSTSTSTKSIESTTSINCSPLIMTSASPFLKELVNIKPNNNQTKSNHDQAQPVAFSTANNMDMVPSMLVTMLAKNSGIIDYGNGI